MKNIAILLVLSVIITGNLFSQKVVSGVSESKFVSITKDPPKPPYLEIISGSLQFADNDGDQKIGANGTAYLQFNLNNSGMGPGLDLKVKIQELNNIYGLQYEKESSLGQLDTDNTKTVEIPVSGNMSLKEGNAVFKVWIEEANGFGTDPVIIEVKTQPFIAPKIKIVDYKVSSEKGTTLQKCRPFDLQVLVQNVGQGTAENVTINIPVPENIVCLSGNENINIGTLIPGESRLIDYNLVTTNQYSSTSLPFLFNLNEKYSKYAEDKTITLSMNQAISDNKLIVQGKDQATTEIVIGSLTSDIDKNIPYQDQKNPDRVALIIGNEDYSGTLNAEVNVEFARNDAKIFMEYAKNTMGIEEDNIYFMLDATAGRMRKQIDLVTDLIKKMGNNAELIFYYAGHGFPDENTKTPYLIPVDVDATNLDPAIRLSEIYKNFAETGAKRVTVFLDACFSGGGRNQGLLAARSVVIKPKDELISGNMVVFSASSGEQSALPYDKQKHGMFTYFLLKKLQDTGGNVTYKELADYLNQKVGIESLRENGKAQDPEVNVSPSVDNIWMDWTLN
ncbi:MAG: caspase family protein [Bacteroidales bacterium]|nr:caspase family protein [Bacteroidales bacterium]